FLLEFQDSTLTYQPFSITQPGFMGFCSDTGAGCTPATASSAASGCSAGAVCYAYGFCSTSVSGGKAAQKCTTDPVANYLCGTCTNGKCQNNPQLTCGTSTSAIASCSGTDSPTCNLVAGIPGTPWNTTPLDNSNGVELITLSNATNSFSVNYRSEPLFPLVNTGSSAANASDVAFAYKSIDR